MSGQNISNFFSRTVESVINLLNSLCNLFTYFADTSAFSQLDSSWLHIWDPADKYTCLQGNRIMLTMLIMSTCLFLQIRVIYFIEFKLNEILSSSVP